MPPHTAAAHPPLVTVVPRPGGARTRWPWLALALALLHAPDTAAADLPIFDAHVHDSAPDWPVHSPEAIIARLDRAGVRRALVSSTPDEGTMALWGRARDRIVPFLRPYRTPADVATWHADPAVAAYVDDHPVRGIYYGSEVLVELRVRLQAPQTALMRTGRARAA